MSTFTLFAFAEVKATITISDEANVIGRIDATGFDAGGTYQFGNIKGYYAYFDGPAERDLTISECLAFCAAEMKRRSEWYTTA